ncbi:2-oxo acid dehydrogenase subunit E2 [Ktedonosporobacter rubrisoli]|uniref:Dihydrolipoamide acetyltransferase component of pyruvate dehydrogenase complex n=1 Tax=Ktedonosporobacter rubrisoli TaxID=2509675 RepID=A0A4P6JV06_KTERU|nr:dihydrolipoamide acetyltransferase family protein [Ktedonosporobacter rubrisoli]QBD79334.1 2-oxo acid dehydrogenase subunit E2 [Ktedonosporobacter rubrisoli]
MQEFRLPDLGEGMQEAEIRRWLVNPGDTVKLDQPMVEVETDKAVVEIPSPVAGRIATIRVEAGQVAKLGELLVTFETGSDKAPANRPAAQPAAAAPPVTTVNSAAPLTNAGQPASTKRVLAAPAVRKRAFELDIDLAQVPSSQPNGRVTLDDVLSYAEGLKNAKPVAASISEQSEPALPGANGQAKTVGRPATTQVSAALEERQPLTGLRRRIAEHMERSWRTVPHATAFDELDGTELAALRQALKPAAEKRGVRLTYMPLLIKLLLPALKEFPIFNASLDEEKREIVYKRFYHIGVATDSPEGLLVPVLRDADKLTVLQIAEQLEHLVAGAQKRTLAVHEVAGSTFTLNNVGSFGGSSGTPIINYPEVAILGVGRLQEKAVVRDGTIIARLMMPLALSFDHRLIDGALSGRFLARFKELVEHPQQLMLDMV